MLAPHRHQKGRHVKFKRAPQIKEITVRDQPVQNGIDPRQIQSRFKEIDLSLGEKGMESGDGREQRQNNGIRPSGRLQ